MCFDCFGPYAAARRGLVFPYNGTRVLGWRDGWGSGFRGVGVYELRGLGCRAYRV